MTYQVGDIKSKIKLRVLCSLILGLYRRRKPLLWPLSLQRMKDYDLGGFLLFLMHNQTTFTVKGYHVKLAHPCYLSNRGIMKVT